MMWLEWKMSIFNNKKKIIIEWKIKADTNWEIIIAIGVKEIKFKCWKKNNSNSIIPRQFTSIVRCITKYAGHIFGYHTETQHHFLSAAAKVPWKHFCFCFFCLAAILLMIMWYFQTQRLIRRHFKRAKPQPARQHGIHIDAWHSRCHSPNPSYPLPFPFHFAFLYGRHTHFILGPLFICGSYILCRTHRFYPSTICVLPSPLFYCVCHSLHLSSCSKTMFSNLHVIDGGLDC